MKLLGFNFDKISIEKLSGKLENLKIDTQIDIPEIKSVDSDLFKIKEDLLGIRFVFKINYEPECAKVELLGNLLLSVDSKTSKDVLKQWKEKKMPDDFRVTLFNLILRKSSLQALKLEEELNLPLHLPFPSIRMSEEDK
jgi:hypothetical protein